MVYGRGQSKKYKWKRWFPIDIPTPVIPGGDVGDEGGVVQLMRYVTDPIDDANIIEERDEDQRLSKEEYDVYTYPDHQFQR